MTAQNVFQKHKWNAIVTILGAHVHSRWRFAFLHVENHSIVKNNTIREITWKSTKYPLSFGSPFEAQNMNLTPVLTCKNSKFICSKFSKQKKKTHKYKPNVYTFILKKAIYWVKIEINFLQHSFKSHTSHIRLSEAPPKRKKITHLKTPSHSNEKMSFLCTILHIKGYTKNTSWLKCG